MDGSGRLAFAVSEERLTRRAGQAGFPVRAIGLAMEERLARGGRLEAVAIADTTGRASLRFMDRWYRTARPPAGPLDPAAQWAARWSRASARIWAGASERSSRRILQGRLNDLGLAGLPFALVDHHDSHAWSAAAGADDALVLTMDAYGDGVSAGIYRLERGLSPHPRLRRCRRVPAPHSPALLVAVVAQVLGFADGGKLPAWAADGDPARLRSVFAHALHLDDGIPRMRGPDALPQLAASLSGEPAADVAAALQAHVQDIVIGMLRAAHRDFGGRALRLAGSLFSNVALNRAVTDAALGMGMESVFVFPAMDDEGLCAGAALAARVGRGGGLLGISDARVGPLAWDESAPVPVQSPALPITADGAAVRGALSSGEVVARCTRRMEFGPRALGSRCLFLRPDQPARAARLNEALGRDPRLPFGIVLPMEHADKLLHWEPAHDPLTHYMTVSLPATDALRERAPLAVHRDGTALARVLRRSADPVLHDLLLQTEGHVLLNTSLNLHREPIACTLQDAVTTSAAAGAALLWVG